MNTHNIVLLNTIYTQVLGEYKTDKELQWKHRGGFIHYLKEGVKQKKLNPQFYKNAHNIKKLSYALDINRDSLLSYEELKIMTDKYFLKNANGIWMETPQYFWMRIAMGTCIYEKASTTTIVNIYNSLSTLKSKANLEILLS